LSDERKVRAVGVVIFIAGTSLAACGSSNALCSLEARSGVNVTLTDAVTKKPVCDAKVVITDGDFRDEPTPLGSDCLYAGASERVGTYKVEVTHPTYAPVTREGVEVKLDEAQCHVVAQQIAIEMKTP
jgi:hypothetical protein